MTSDLDFIVQHLSQVPTELIPTELIPTELIPAELIPVELVPAELPQSGWERFGEGIEILPLFNAGVNGAAAALLRYAAGAKGPRHLHRGEERVMVLSGSQRDDRGTYQAGALVIKQAGTVHQVSSDDGCVALVYWSLPVLFLAEDDGLDPKKPENSAASDLAAA